jgi:hypothetical protein
MEIVILAMWIAGIGWFFHRRQVRAAEAETEELRPAPETQPWEYKPRSKPTPESWEATWLNATSLMLCGAVVAAVIVLVGLAVW